MQPQRAREADVPALQEQRFELVYGQRRLQLSLFRIGDSRSRGAMSRSPARSLAVRATSSALALCVIGSAAQADPGTPAYPEGAAAFAANCSVCHGAKGTGTPSLAPPLTSYPARYAADPEGRRQLSNTVLAGLFG